MPVGENPTRRFFRRRRLASFLETSMCRFFSSIVTRDGRILWHPVTDQHELLIEHFSLDDKTDHGAAMERFVRCEFYPKNPADGAKLEMYRLRIDEAAIPSWMDGERQAETTTRMAEIIRGMIVTDKRLLLGGVWIVTGNGDVRLYGGRAELWGNATAVLRDNATAVLWGNATAVLWGNATAVLWGNATAVLRDNAKAVLRDNAKVTEDHRIGKK
jgi:hypothetical protein